MVGNAGLNRGDRVTRRGFIAWVGALAAVAITTGTSCIMIGAS